MKGMFVLVSMVRRAKRRPSRTHLDDILAEALKRDPRMKKYAVRDEEDKTRVRESLCRDLEREAIVVD